jgi:hypothetical protein
MYRFGWMIARLAGLALIVGCGGKTPVAPSPNRPKVPLSIQRPEHGTRVFASEEEVTTSFPFEGPTGASG